MSAWAPENMLARLAGAWKLARTITGGGRLHGEAVFSARPDGGLDYHEAGQLRLPTGQSFAAERRYVFQPEPGDFAVFFAEEPPRLFHAVHLAREGENLAGEARHLCAPDIYDSRYVFEPDGTFTIRHVVAGPRKDYVMLSRYRRG